jgi:hypothetical protein
MSSDENFEDNCVFVQTLDKDERQKFIPIDRIQVVSKRKQYSDSDDWYVEVRYQNGDEYPTAQVDENDLLRKCSDAKDRIVPAVPGTWCIGYYGEVRRWPIIAWRLRDKWTRPIPIMLDPVSFDPLVENFTILFPDGIVFRTMDEKFWNSLEEWKEDQRKAKPEAAERSVLDRRDEGEQARKSWSANLS